MHSTHLSQVIKSQNKIIYMVVKHLYSLKIINISKINNMRRPIKTLKHNIIVTDAPINTTDFPVIKVHVDELSSARIWQHKLCVTLSANVNINHRLPIKVYYNICTLRHIRIKINHESQTHSDFHDLYLN